MSVQANMATWSKAELEIAMGMTQDCSRAHELGEFLLRSSPAGLSEKLIVSNYSAFLTALKPHFASNLHLLLVSVHAGLLHTQSKAQHVLKHIESNVETELDGWTVRHAAGYLRSAYAEVRQEWLLRTIPSTDYSCMCAAQPFVCWHYCKMLSNKRKLSRYH